MTVDDEEALSGVSSIFVVGRPLVVVSPRLNVPDLGVVLDDQIRKLLGVLE